VTLIAVTVVQRYISVMHAVHIIWGNCFRCCRDSLIASPLC